MPWLELAIRVDREAVPAAEAALEEAGALAVTLEDDADVPVLEPGVGETPLWPVVQVKGLFDRGVDRQQLAAAVAPLTGGGRPHRLVWREVGDRDWERAWLDRFGPMRFGRRLWIVPTGRQAEKAPGRVQIRLDPGLAFGTGTHPTTALCLEWLDGQDLAGAFVVDYGCGSGILGIAAALLGAARVVCVDNDPQALDATAANAARNGVEARIACVAPGDFAQTGADLVLANILAGPLIELAPVLTGCARPGAGLVLSGLLEEQVEAVSAAYAKRCEATGQATRDGWARIELQLRQPRDRPR